MSDALVLAGAVAQGAFTAGALSVLSEPDSKSRLGLDFARIVGASSGALNATYYAAAIRAGKEAFAGQRLTQLWLDDATLHGVFDLSLRDLVATLGLSTQHKLLELLRRNIEPGPGVNAIDLRLVVTNVDGEPIEVNGSAATTFEHVVEVPGAAFDSSESLERVFAATVASAALPGLFAPARVVTDDMSFRGFDGGIVNDAPLGHALRGAPEIDRVFVIAPFPRIRREPPDLHGLPLAWHVLDIIVQERLVRDLLDVGWINECLAKLLPLLPDPAQRDAVLGALGWTGRRPVQVIEIRPEGELPGDSFSGFASRELRQQYTRAGVDAARRLVGH
jgi:predicted acylesterase/phospholipase RssA